AGNAKNANSSAAIPRISLNIAMNPGNYYKLLILFYISEAIAKMHDSILDPAHGNDLDPGDRLPRLVGMGHQRMGETQLGRLLQPLLAALYRTHLAGKTNLAEHHQLLRQRLVLQRTHHSHQHRK